MNGTELERYALLVAGLGFSWDTYIYDRLLEAYSEEGRYYHTLEHIASGLNVLDRLGANPETKLAFWWHDVVYSTAIPEEGELSNEEWSAELLLDLHRHDRFIGRGGVRLLDEAARLVRITQTHKVEWFDKNARDMIVADLYSLSHPRERYAWGCFNIRKEYRQYTDDQWREGRIKFITSMLGGRARIYPPFPEFSVMENYARANLTDEKRALESTFGEDK